MTHSNRSEYSDRSSRQWNDHDDRWDQRRKPQRDVLWDSYHRYGGDGHSSTERTSKSREYSNSPKRVYNKDSLARDWSRKSPVRRHQISPDQGASERERKRQRYTEDSEDDYRYRLEREDKTYRQSSDGFPHLSKDFKRTLPEEDDFKYRKAQDSKHRQWQEELIHRKQHDDYRSFSPYHKDESHRERRWDRSQERTHDHFSKSCTKARERNDSYTDYDDHCQNRTRFPLNGKQSFESEITNHSPAVNEQRSTEGFQRFLSVLNKGVDVEKLTKIVTQNSTELDDQPQSPVSFMNTAEALRSPVSARRQQGSHWSEHKGSQRLDSPEAYHQSISPSDEKTLQTSGGEPSYFHSNSKSRSPSVVEKITLTSEDEHKHKQIQDVLQAIGVDLGFEELGQMSHRIQERLYGKKDSDWGCHRRGSKERKTRRVSSPRRRSRSSSSRSNFSPFNQDYSLKKDSSSAQVHQMEGLRAVEFGHNSNNSSLQDYGKCETVSHKVTAPLEAFTTNPAYTVSKAPLTPGMPTYSPVNCPLLPYPALPPNLPHIVPGLFLPRLPPFLPYPHIPSLNIFPAVLSQTRHLLPQHISNHQSPFFNLPDIKPTQPLNTTKKSKTLSRPRCLQIIEPKQPE